MADTKISALPAADALTGAELSPVVQSSATRRTTLSLIRDFVRSGLTLAWSAITGTPTTLNGYGITDAASDAELAAHAAQTGAGAHLSSADKTKLDGIAAGATANATDAQLRDRSTHTGTQAISTITGLQAALDGKLAAIVAQTLVDGASIAWNVGAGVAATVTLGGNRTLANPSGLQAGSSYVLIVKQDATGGRTLAFGSAYKWPGGSAPTLSTAPNAVDVLTFISDGTVLYGVAAKAFA